METIKNKLPINQKLLLTIPEAMEYANIGANKMRSLANMPSCPFIIYNGNRQLIKRKQFESWIESQTFI